MTESFPRQEARTRRFSLGVPRAFRVSPDGARVAYLRTKSGTDPVTCLWVLDVATGQERLAADPRALSPDRDGAGEEDLPPEERARRERVREQAGGIVAYSTDRDVTVAAFALSGRVYTVPLTGDGAGGGGPARCAGPRGGHAHAGPGSPPGPGRAAAGVRLRGRAAGRPGWPTAAAGTRSSRTRGARPA